MVERRGSAVRVIGHGRVSLPAKRPLADRLVLLAEALEELLERHAPDVAVLESLFRGRNVRSLIVLAQARGVLVATVARAGVAMHEYAPAEIKSAVTGDGRADKEQVAKMVRMILGLRDARLEADAADALAAAICFAQRARLDSLAVSGGSRRGRRR